MKLFINQSGRKPSGRKARIITQEGRKRGRKWVYNSDRPQALRPHTRPLAGRKHTPLPQHPQPPESPANETRGGGGRD